MGTKILKIPFAIRDGRLVHISEVESGLSADCLCPACKNALVARKGKIKVHHFAHSVETNCQPETVTHLLGKQLLAERLEAAIQAGKPFEITWKCAICSDQHVANLAEGATAVRLEHSLGDMRPDLALFGQEGDVRAVVEVVVTHAPEDSALAFCATNKIPMFEYRIKKLSDLEAMRGADRLDPSKSTHCTRPKCEKCGLPLVNKTLYVVTGECWKCHADMRIAFLSCEICMRSPEQMTELEVKEAEKLGACLRQNWSATLGRTYLSNTCVTCGALSGSHYLHDFWHLAAGVEGIPTGLVCAECDYGQGAFRKS